jgi:hypothetical protein
MMSSDIIMMQMSTKNVMFSRAQTGWIFFREDKKVSRCLSTPSSDQKSSFLLSYPKEHDEAESD